MKNRNARSVEGSSENSTDAETNSLLPASPLTLEVVRDLAVLAYNAADLATARGHIREQMQMLDQLIERSESEEEAIYEWASGQ